MKDGVSPKDIITLIDQIHSFDACYQEIKADLSLFCEKNNHSAARRARKNLQAIKKMATEIRMAIQAAKKRTVRAVPPEKPAEAPSQGLLSERALRRLKVSDLIGLDKK